MTIISNRTIAQILHIMQQNPKATEDKLVNICNDPILQNARLVSFSKLTKRTLQRVKRHLREMSDKERQDLLVMYIDYPIKRKMYAQMVKDDNTSYKEFTLNMDIIEVDHDTKMKAIWHEL